MSKSTKKQVGVELEAEALSTVVGAGLWENNWFWQTDSCKAGMQREYDSWYNDLKSPTPTYRGDLPGFSDEYAAAGARHASWDYFSYADECQ
jgi:hypothetical protein